MHITSRHLYPVVLLLLAIIIALSSSCRQNEQAASGGTLAAPVAKKVRHMFKEYGKDRADDYLWMSYPEDPEVIAHLQAENAYCDQVMAPYRDLQETLFKEMSAREEEAYQTVPVQKNGYFYYERYAKGAEYPILCRRKGSMASPEEILLDMPELAKGFEIFRLYTYAVSPDNQLLCYLLDTAGDRRNMLFIKDLRTGQLLSDRVSNAADESLAWAKDSKTLFYVTNDHTVRGYQLRRHTLGTPAASDPVLYTERDSTFELHVEPSFSHQFIFAWSWSTSSTECRFLDAATPAKNWQLVQARQDNVQYFTEHYNGAEFHILTNHKAQNFKIVTAPIALPAMTAWKDLVPHRDSALIESYTVLKNYIILQEKINGLNRLEVIKKADNSRYFVDFGEPDYVAELSTGTDAYDVDSIRYEFTSLKTPYSTYSYDLLSRTKVLLRQARIGGGYDPTLYETQRVWVTARDGAKVPVSVVYRKDKWQKDGAHPFYLYAYGSYGSNSDPYFEQEIISLLDRGFAYGIAHIRGGQEMGRQWYENSKVLTKKHTFNDFVDCAELLVKEKYTSTDRLFANGLSAGGMLMGVVINMLPDLFRGVIAEVPWMDVITDMYNDDLPLTTLEYSEWGDPHIREQYDYMLSWSPYDNLKPTKFPAILATGGLNDTQVTYYNPAKWVAKVRELNQGDNPVLFKCNMDAGHGGASGRFDRFHLQAMKYAWVLSLQESK